MANTFASLTRSDTGQSVRYDEMFRIALVGDSTVGKTTLMNRFTDDVFFLDPRVTVGVDWKFKVVVMNGKTIKIQIWDTAGQERFSSLAPLYARRAQGILIFYDITSLESFQNVEFWLRKLDITTEKEIVLIGNKLDLSDGRTVSTEMGRNKAADMREGGIAFFETSCKTNHNVCAIFDYVIRRLLSRQGGQDPLRDTIQLHEQPPPEAKKSCCAGSVSEAGEVLP